MFPFWRDTRSLSALGHNCANVFSHFVCACMYYTQQSVFFFFLPFFICTRALYKRNHSRLFLQLVCDCISIWCFVRVWSTECDGKFQFFFFFVICAASEIFKSQKKMVKSFKNPFFSFFLSYLNFTYMQRGQRKLIWLVDCEFCLETLRYFEWMRTSV